jgi:S1-C subfamily serine protease
VIDGQGHVLTAGHVVHRLEDVDVGLDNGTTLQGKVVGRNPYADLALVQVQSGGLEPLERGSSSDIKVGQFVLALARPFGGRPSVTSGIVTGVNRQVGGWWRFSIGNAIVTDARLNPGYSGGPLVDAKGRMIGMNVAYFSNRGIAVPMDTITGDIERLARGEGFRRAYLGIVSNPIQLPDDVASRLANQQKSGLMVLSVEPGSSAKKAGLVLGDVVVRFGDKQVNNLQDLESVLNEDVIGKEAKLTVLRQEQQKVLTVVPSTSGE